MVALIGLAGRKGSGKDSAFGFLSEWAESRGLVAARRGFADKLKVSAMAALGFVGTDEDLLVLANELKDLGEITTCIPNQSVLYTIEGRKFFQLYGTEAHRDVFGEDFWVDALLPNTVRHTDYGKAETVWQENFDNADIAVVTDVRFPNEAARICELGGEIWEVQRSTDQVDAHVSETPLDRKLISVEIGNAGSLDDLRDIVVLLAEDRLT